MASPASVFKSEIDAAKANRPMWSDGNGAALVNDLGGCDITVGSVVITLTASDALSFGNWITEKFT